MRWIAYYQDVYDVRDLGVVESEDFEEALRMSVELGGNCIRREDVPQPLAHHQAILKTIKNDDLMMLKWEAASPKQKNLMARRFNQKAKAEFDKLREPKDPGPASERLKRAKASLPVCTAPGCGTILALSFNDHRDLCWYHQKRLDLGHSLLEAEAKTVLSPRQRKATEKSDVSEV